MLFQAQPSWKQATVIMADSEFRNNVRGLRPQNLRVSAVLAVV
jgi:hypothetical protein